MANISIKSSDILPVLKKVREELDTFLPLEKKEAKKEASKKPEASEASSKPAPKEASSPAPEASASSSPEGTPTSEETPGESTPGAPPVDASATPDASASSAPVDPAVGSAEPTSTGGDMPSGEGSLESMYSAMPQEILKAHFMALKKVIFDKHMPPVDAAPVDPSLAAGSPDASVSTEAPPVEDTALPVAKTMKNEVSKGVEMEGSPEASVSKSEGDNDMADLKKTEELAKKLDELQKTVDNVIKVVELGFARPERKAVVTLDGLTKSEPTKKTFTSVEIKAKLNELTAHPEELKKSDRDLIMGYFDGNIDVSKIEHLLK